MTVCNTNANSSRTVPVALTVCIDGSASSATKEDLLACGSAAAV